METCAFRAEVMSVICSAYTLPCDIVHGVSLQMSKAVKEWSLVVLEATVVGSSQNLVIGSKIISFLFLLWSLTSNQNAAYKNRVTPDMKNEEPLEVLLWAVLGSPVPKHHYLMATITFLIDWETEFLQFSFFSRDYDENDLEKKAFTTESLRSQYCAEATKRQHHTALPRCPSSLSLLPKHPSLFSWFLFPLLVGACLPFSASAELCLLSPWKILFTLFVPWPSEPWGFIFRVTSHKGLDMPDAKPFHGRY